MCQSVVFCKIKGCGFANWVLLHLFAMKYLCCSYSLHRALVTVTWQTCWYFVIFHCFPTLRTELTFFPKLNLKEDGPLTLLGHKICAQEWCKSSRKKSLLLHWDYQSLTSSHLFADLERKPKKIAILSSVGDMKMISWEITNEKSVTFLYK